MARVIKPHPWQLAIHNGLKTCPGCKETKPVDQFHKRKDRTGGRMSRCKVCTRSASVSRRLDNNKRMTKWRKLHPEAAREISRRYYERHPEVSRARAKRNYSPDKNRATVQKRRARKKQAGGTFDQDDIKFLMKTQKGLCASQWCKKDLQLGYHVDHIMPLALNGSNDRRNIQLLCPLCNQRKKDKHPIDFARQNGMLL
jgi:5-methylcytosine-specific restriction endonuclease McrA